MSDVFISYSRKDKEFVQVLHQALSASQYDAWIDWEDIPLTADWWEEIKNGIEAADTFVFVISPDSVNSSVCGEEIDHAVANNKRLMPIVRRDGFDVEQVRPALGRHNWLFFREEDNFNSAFQALVRALDTDLGYVRQHTRVLVRAIEWDKKAHNESFVLRGTDLEEAEQWLQQAADKKPQPTELQIKYIYTSRKVEEANQILLEAGRKARRMIQVGAAVMISTISVAIVVGITAQRRIQAANQQVKQAQENLKLVQEGTRLEETGASTLRQFQSGATEKIGILVSAMQTGRKLESLASENRLSLEKYPATSPLMTLQIILDNLPEQLQPKTLKSRRIFSRHKGAVTGLSFAPDGQSLATAGQDRKVQVCKLANQPCKVLAAQKVLTNLTFSSDGKSLAGVGQDGTIQVLNLLEQKVRSVPLPEGIVTAFSISQDGQQIATIDGRGIVQLWEWSWQELRLYPKVLQIKNDSGGIIDVSFSQNNQSLLTAEPNGVVRLWDLSGKVLIQFNSYQDLRQVRLSPDGEKIATVGLDDGTVKLWNLTGRQIAQYGGIANQAINVSFNLNGKQLAIAFSNGTVQVQPIRSLKELLAQGCSFLKDSQSYSEETAEACSSKQP